MLTTFVGKKRAGVKPRLKVVVADYNVALN